MHQLPRKKGLIFVTFSSLSLSLSLSLLLLLPSYAWVGICVHVCFHFVLWIKVHRGMEEKWVSTHRIGKGHWNPLLSHLWLVLTA